MWCDVDVSFELGLRNLHQFRFVLKGRTFAGHRIEFYVDHQCILAKEHYLVKGTYDFAVDTLPLQYRWEVSNLGGATRFELRQVQFLLATFDANGLRTYHHPEYEPHHPEYEQPVDAIVVEDGPIPDARPVLEEKLAFLQQELAITADGAQKFALIKQIEDVKQQLRALGS